MSVLFSIAMIIFSYLLGSLCSAIIVSKLFSLPDPREAGSKNAGATNILRLAGKKYALIVFSFDMLKGFVPVLCVYLLGGNHYLAAYTALAAVIGHMYPVFFKFKGGKGVATAMGAILAYQVVLGVAVILTWLVVASLMRISSLASIISIISLPCYSLFFTGVTPSFTPLFFMMLLILFQHRNNITRLTEGTEPKFSLSSQIKLGLEPEIEQEVKEDLFRDLKEHSKPKAKPARKKPAPQAKKEVAAKKPSDAKKTASVKKPSAAKKPAANTKTAASTKKKSASPASNLKKKDEPKS